MPYPNARNAEFAGATGASTVQLNTRCNRYNESVPKARPPANRPTPTPEENAFVDLLRTCDLLSRPLAQVLKTAELSATQYNVLRILRGAPEGLPCGEVGSRMITRDPDITRLLDRLEKRGLVSRWRDASDRRTVLTRITPAGLKLLTSLDGPIQQVHVAQLGHLGRARLSALRELLQLARGRIT